MNEMLNMWGQLGGCKYGLIFANKTDANRAIRRLSNCTRHNGVHHFAVVSEGCGIAFSEAGRDCLIDAGIITKDSV